MVLAVSVLWAGRAGAAPFDPAWLTPYLDRGQPALARDALRAGQNERAARLLSGLSQKAHVKQWHQIRFLLGQAQMRRGKFAEAAALFSELEQSYPLLADYHRYFGARSLVRLGRHDQAVARLAAIKPGSVLWRKVLRVRAEALWEAGKFSHGAAAWQRLLELAPYGKGAARVHYYLGRYHEKRAATHRKAAATALDHYQQVTARFALSSLADDAEKAIGRIVKKYKLSNKLSLSLLFTRADVLYRGMRNASSEKAYDGLLKRQDLSKAQRCVAAYRRARSVFKARQRARSEPLFAKAAALCQKAGDRQRVVKSMYNRARGLFRQKKFEEAIAQFGQIEKRYADHSYADDALLRAAEVATEMGKPKRAMAMLTELPTKYPAGDMVREAMWRVAKAAYIAGDKKEALATLNRIVDTLGRADIYYAEGRALYWRARILEQLKRVAEARVAYERCIRDYPLSYYALLSFNRLREGHAALFRKLSAELLAPVGEAAGRWSFDPRPLFGQPAFLRGVELARLGFGTLAARELASAGVKVKRGAATEDLWLAAVLYHRAGLWDLSHRVPRTLDRAYRHSYPLRDNVRPWRVSYPLAFEPLVRAEARRAGIPPELVWSVMREESGFHTTVESYANAIGLMQLILPTARTAAAEHKLKVRRALLHDPAVNIKLGATYLGFLMRGFHKTLALAISGYNACEGATFRWVKARGTIPLDEFVERIPYDQTRRYTKRVLSTLFTYTVLHTSGKDRVPVIGLKVPKVSLKELRRSRKPKKSKKK